MVDSDSKYLVVKGQSTEKLGEQVDWVVLTGIDVDAEVEQGLDP